MLKFFYPHEHELKPLFVRLDHQNNHKALSEKNERSKQKTISTETKTQETCRAKFNNYELNFRLIGFRVTFVVVTGQFARQ